MSVVAVIALSLICGITVAAIEYNRGRDLWELLLLLTRLDEKLISALFRP